MDIVERLRESDNETEYAHPAPSLETRPTLAWEAADTIETLRARVGELESKWLSPETYETLMGERKETLHELAASQAENARLREALHYVARFARQYTSPEHPVIVTARQALAGDK